MLAVRVEDDLWPFGAVDDRFVQDTGRLLAATPILDIADRCLYSRRHGFHLFQRRSGSADSR